LVGLNQVLTDLKSSEQVENLELKQKCKHLKVDIKALMITGLIYNTVTV